ncbi:MAG: PIG-L deacetylase family protein [Steroidobacteraceae bacterium]
MSGGRLILAPHPDDESLGCGLLLATRSSKEPLHIAFVTDGAGQGPDRHRLAASREIEARRAAAVYGLGDGQLHFLRLPDGGLARLEVELARLIRELVAVLRPETVHVPFRFDGHPDHLAVNRVACKLHDAGDLPASLLEYFVYTHSRMVPGGDVRKLIDPRWLTSIAAEPHAVSQRQRALECHSSQVSAAGGRWRPVLSPELLARLASEPERHLAYDPAVRGSGVLTQARAWVPLAARLEPFLKYWIDRVLRRQPWP